jgi:ribonucleoside-diphosphate reductase alpha chain
VQGYYKIIEEIVRSTGNSGNSVGLFGWHDTLIKLGIRYGSDISLNLANSIGSKMIDAAIRASAILTDKYGCYPKYDKEAVQSSEFYIKNTNAVTKAMVEKKGLANSQLLTIAPTGSTGTMLGVSTGLEPIYNISYTRKTESLHGKDEFYKVYTPIVEEYMKANGITKEEDLPDFFNTAMTLDYRERIEMQSTWQKYIDASISSTVNVPQSFTVEQVEDLYMLAWEKGLKGVTIYRDNCARSGILTSTTSNTDDKTEYEYEELPRGYIEDVPEGLVYRKYKLKTGCGNLYFFVGVDEMDGKIYDCFTNTDGVGGCTVNTQANSRLLSAALRAGAPVEYLIEQLNKAGVCPSFQYKRGKGEKLCNGKSCPSAIANILKEILKEFAEDNEEHENVVVHKVKNPCPSCGNELKIEGGCNSCVCGYSKCD